MGGGRIATEVLLAQWVQLNTKYLITETSSREMPRQSTVHSLRFPPKLTNPYFWPESALREDSPNPPRTGQESPEVFSDSMLSHMLFPLPGRSFPPSSEAWCLPSSCQVATSLFPFYRRGTRGSEGLSNLFKATQLCPRMLVVVLLATLRGM